MAIKRVNKYGDKILRKKTKQVDYKAIKKDLKSILKDMTNTMEAAGGIGLSANQMGLDLKLAIVRYRKSEDEFIDIIIINPEIVEQSGSTTNDEGCLSLPGLFAKTKRFTKVKVLALNEKGMPVEMIAEGLLARAFQHEIDHLNGILFIDKLPLLSKLKLKPVLRKMKKVWAKIDESSPDYKSSQISEADCEF
ncbi:MAG: peptide deformylase [Elusimicrobiales bacterium]|nr:peptide deformylase [Elusimicrobiales bacterium]